MKKKAISERAIIGFDHIINDRLGEWLMLRIYIYIYVYIYIYICLCVFRTKSCELTSTRALVLRTRGSGQFQRSTATLENIEWV